MNCAEISPRPVVAREAIAGNDKTMRQAALNLIWVSQHLDTTRQLEAYLADYIGQDSNERVAGTFYGIILLLATTLLLVLWRYAVWAHLVRPDAADEEIQLL